MGKFYLISIFIIVSLTIQAETFECVYIEGDASYFDGEIWEYLDFGTLLEKGAKIKVEDLSTVQFKSSANSLFFSRRGEYFLGQNYAGKGQDTALAKN